MVTPDAGAVLGRSSAATAEDPFGDGDPVEVARLVRRALAAAGCRAMDVDALVVVTDGAPDAARLARFTRRALGPHGERVPPVALAAEPVTGHEERLAVAAGMAARLVPDRGRVAIAVALGPGAAATALCIAGGTAEAQPGPSH